jgi:phosphodiesterase/alkaline phosphatase D-like protein
VTGLAANTSYYYRVRAFNGNASLNSNVIKAKTKAH